MYRPSRHPPPKGPSAPGLRQAAAAANTNTNATATTAALSGPHPRERSRERMVERDVMPPPGMSERSPSPRHMNYHLYDQIGRGRTTEVFKGRRKNTIEFVVLKRYPKNQREFVLNEDRVMRHLASYNPLQNPSDPYHMPLQSSMILRGSHIMPSDSIAPHAHVLGGGGVIDDGGRWHENILRYIEQFESRNHVWVVYEYCPGQDLRTVLTMDGRMPEISLQDFGRAMACGIRYLHSQGFVHGELAPGNALFNESGVLKLRNFGATRSLDELLHEIQLDAGLPLRGSIGQQHTPHRRAEGLEVMGAPCYWSPELIRSGMIPTIHSDLWAYGCILYESLMGHIPFQADTVEQLKHMILAQEVEFPPIDKAAPRRAARGDRKYDSRGARKVPPDDPRDVRITPQLLSLLKGLLTKDWRHRITWEDLVSHELWDPPQVALTPTERAQLDKYTDISLQILRATVGDSDDLPPSPMVSRQMGDEAAYQDDAYVDEDDRMNAALHTPIKRGSHGSAGGFIRDPARPPYAEEPDRYRPSSTHDRQEYRRERTAMRPQRRQDRDREDESPHRLIASPAVVRRRHANDTDNSHVTPEATSSVAAIDQQQHQYQQESPGDIYEQFNGEVPPQMDHDDDDEQEGEGEDGDGGGGRRGVEDHQMPRLTMLSNVQPTKRAKLEKLLCEVEGSGGFARRQPIYDQHLVKIDTYGSNGGDDTTLADEDWEQDWRAHAPFSLPSFDALKRKLQRDEMYLPSLLSSIFKTLAANEPYGRSTPSSQSDTCTTEQKTAVVKYVGCLAEVGWPGLADALLRSQLTKLLVNVVHHETSPPRASYRVATLSALGQMIRHGGDLPVELGRSYRLWDVLINILTKAPEGDHDVKLTRQLRRQAAATFGELLYYVAVTHNRQRPSGDGFPTPDDAPAIIKKLIIDRRTVGEDPIVVHFAVRTLGNIATAAGRWALERLLPTSNEAWQIFYNLACEAMIICSAPRTRPTTPRAAAHWQAHPFSPTPTRQQQQQDARIPSAAAPSPAAAAAGGPIAHLDDWGQTEEPDQTTHEWSPYLLAVECLKTLSELATLAPKWWHGLLNVWAAVYERGEEMGVYTREMTPNVREMMRAAMCSHMGEAAHAGVNLALVGIVHANDVEMLQDLFQGDMLSTVLQLLNTRRPLPNDVKAKVMLCIECLMGTDLIFLLWSLEYDLMPFIDGLWTARAGEDRSEVDEQDRQLDTALELTLATLTDLVPSLITQLEQDAQSAVQNPNGHPELTLEEIIRGCYDYLTVPMQLLSSAIPKARSTFMTPNLIQNLSKLTDHSGCEPLRSAPVDVRSRALEVMEGMAGEIVGGKRVVLVGEGAVEPELLDAINQAMIPTLTRQMSPQNGPMVCFQSLKVLHILIPPLMHDLHSLMPPPPARKPPNPPHEWRSILRRPPVGFHVFVKSDRTRKQRDDGSGFALWSRLMQLTQPNAPHADVARLSRGHHQPSADVLGCVDQLRVLLVTQVMGQLLPLLDMEDSQGQGQDQGGAPLRQYSLTFWFAMLKSSPTLLGLLPDQPEGRDEGREGGRGGGGEGQWTLKAQRAYLVSTLNRFIEKFQRSNAVGLFEKSRVSLEGILTLIAHTQHIRHSSPSAPQPIPYNWHIAALFSQFWKHLAAQLVDDRFSLLQAVHSRDRLLMERENADVMKSVEAPDNDNKGADTAAVERRSVAAVKDLEDHMTAWQLNPIHGGDDSDALQDEYAAIRGANDTLDGLVPPLSTALQSLARSLPPASSSSVMDPSPMSMSTSLRESSLFSEKGGLLGGRAGRLMESLLKVAAAEAAAIAHPPEMTISSDRVGVGVSDMAGGGLMAEAREEEALSRITEGRTEVAKMIKVGLAATQAALTLLCIAYHHSQWTSPPQHTRLKDTTATSSSRRDDQTHEARRKVISPAIVGSMTDLVGWLETSLSVAAHIVADDDKKHRKSGVLRGSGSSADSVPMGSRVSDDSGHGPSASESLIPLAELLHTLEEWGRKALCLLMWASSLLDLHTAKTHHTHHGTSVAIRDPELSAADLSVHYYPFPMGHLDGGTEGLHVELAVRSVPDASGGMAADWVLGVGGMVVGSQDGAEGREKSEAAREAAARLMDRLEETTSGRPVV
ncbi:unnamed protein product [Vitrella brassicaformis CCMP3155]|uniref:Protein kinase domain-containing protein n=7 Tax=Vitrella brassicaformis TaxID=1169539 RepID=A0A0G4GQ03_VITBC|nr:unnamed protein product [Vitrella brassicaformis CCMP3155]|eukprot:CEM32448.1 unnamed protein product [Vitrella brassicaformis CCMP3155]